MFNNQPCWEIKKKKNTDADIYVSCDLLVWEVCKLLQSEETEMKGWTGWEAIFKRWSVKNVLHYFNWRLAIYRRERVILLAVVVLSPLCCWVAAFLGFSLNIFLLQIWLKPPSDINQIVFNCWFIHTWVLITFPNICITPNNSNPSPPCAPHLTCYTEITHVLCVLAPEGFPEQLILTNKANTQHTHTHTLLCITQQLINISTHLSGSAFH